MGVHFQKNQQNSKLKLNLLIWISIQRTNDQSKEQTENLQLIKITMKCSHTDILMKITSKIA